jgi:glycosyltransferase involved in cell wall biosynthesis
MSPRTLPPLPGGVPPQVFLISQSPYGYLHHRSQRIADQFRDWGFPVSYVEENGGWRPYLGGHRKGFGRALGRSVAYHLGTLIGFSPVRGTVPGSTGEMNVVEMPLGVPPTKFDSPLLERWTASLFRHVLERDVLPLRDPRLRTVALVNSPLWGAVLRRGDFDRVVYDCIDDVSLYAGLASPARFLEYERKLLGVSDAVVVTAAPLENHIRSVDQGIPLFRIPNGVAAEWFQESAAEGRLPSEIGELTSPIVGYVGSISGWLNVSLAAEVAALLPSVTFLFVGPEDPWVDLGPLKRLPNVRFLGRRPYDEVPSIIAACRACWIPFSSGKIVEATNPIKLFEYFALGKPVVSTPIPELDPYHRLGLLGIGATAAELVRALEVALAEGDTLVASRRVNVALDHSWEKLIGDLLGVISPPPAGPGGRR